MKQFLKTTTLIVVSFIMMIPVVSADVPMIITYQGILTDNGTPVDGTHSVLFALYDQEADGTLLWDETQSVSFTEGYFTVELGSVDSLNLDFSQQYWLGIAIDGGDELDPRTPTTSSAFSIRAKYVDKLTEQNIHQFWELMQTMTDADGDGYDKISAGGDDCDDMNPYINPGAAELCDNIDNNCDDQVDNGAESDCLPLPPNASQVGCDAGECFVAECALGYRDDNGIFEDGCEYDCSGDEEICDGIDNDCDGEIDEGCDCIDGQTEPCYSGPPETQDVGECSSGIRTCYGGVWGPCIGEQLPGEEVCDGLDNDCDGDPDNNLNLGPEDCGVPPLGVCNWINVSCTGGSIECEYPPEYEEVEITCDGLDNDCDGMVDEDNVCLSPGDLIITEIMQNPAALPDAEGEWFEIYNTTGSIINLNGVTIRDYDTDSFVITGDLYISPGGYLTFANSSSPGFTPDYAYSGLTLANADDELVIETAVQIIDQVVYDDGVTFPDPTGASMNLDPAYYDATNNDNGAYWCTSTSPMGNGDFGTPGSANHSCGVR